MTVAEIVAGETLKTVSGNWVKGLTFVVALIYRAGLSVNIEEQVTFATDIGLHFGRELSCGVEVTFLAGHRGPVETVAVFSELGYFDAGVDRTHFVRSLMSLTTDFILSQVKASIANSTLTLVGLCAIFQSFSEL